MESQIFLFGYVRYLQYWRVLKLIELEELKLKEESHWRMPQDHTGLCIWRYCQWHREFRNYLGLSFRASLFWMIELHSSVSAIVPVSSRFPLFERISFKNLVYEGMCDISLVKGNLIWSFLSSSTNFLNRSSIFAFANLYGHMIEGLIWRRRYIWIIFFFLNYLPCKRCWLTLLFVWCKLTLFILFFFTFVGSGLRLFTSITTFMCPIVFGSICPWNIPYREDVDTFYWDT